MKQVVSDKYSVAWFKIADCIARGEKERALGVYKLLSHSFDDPAMAQQLHGDILLSFQDKKPALHKYKEAATLYQEDGRLLEAAAVYEHLAALEPEVVDHYLTLIELYQQLHIVSKVSEYCKDIVQQLISTNEWVRVMNLVNQFSSYGNDALTTQLHSQLVLNIIDNATIVIDSKIHHAKEAIMAWQHIGDAQAVENFVEDIKARDSVLYSHVVKLK